METKPFWLSTTFQGQAVEVISFLLLVLKVDWLGKEEISFAVGAIIGLVGLSMTIYGRIKAGKNPIKLGFSKHF